MSYSNKIVEIDIESSNPLIPVTTSSSSSSFIFPSIENNSKNSNKNRTIVRLSPTGLRFVNGLSCSYDKTYPKELNGILTEDELVNLVDKLNDTIQSYWPCTACLIFGIACIPCTLGLSLLCPRLCVTEAEKYANRMLENASLKAKYYDRNIVFSFEKSFFKPTYLTVSFPSNLSESDHLSVPPDSLYDTTISSIPISFTRLKDN
jgi:hypothetical protein